LNVFIYVQHLLGTGHLKRAATLARALVAEGAGVTLASGGHPVAGIAPQGARFVQLPPAGTADLSFKQLVDEAGRAVDEGWKRRRRDALLAAWRAARAEVLVLELFPFGRRQMRFELLLLLEEAAARRPVVVCSVRDILGAPKSAERQEETAELIERYFDHVLVHGDPSVARFEQSFSLAARLGKRVSYTGYVVDAVAQVEGSEAGKGEVIVSAGGGAVGAPLLEAAMRARPLSKLRSHAWRVLTGANLPEAQFAALARLVTDGVVLERARADFTTLLANCELAIAQAGYNTLIEIVQAGARAVVVPFAGGHETEQTLRAECFAARGLVECVKEAELSAQSLAAAIDRALGRDRPPPAGIDLDGARNSARLIARWARERRVA
jgi:predicted glycosyltransferase